MKWQSPGTVVCCHECHRHCCCYTVVGMTTAWSEAPCVYNCRGFGVLPLSIYDYYCYAFYSYAFYCYAFYCYAFYSLCLLLLCLLLLCLLEGAWQPHLLLGCCCEGAVQGRKGSLKLRGNTLEAEALPRLLQPYIASSSALLLLRPPPPPSSSALLLCPPPRPSPSSLPTSAFNNSPTRSKQQQQLLLLLLPSSIAPSLHPSIPPSTPPNCNSNTTIHAPMSQRRPTIELHAFSF